MVQCREYKNEDVLENEIRYIAYRKSDKFFQGGFLTERKSAVQEKRRDNTYYISDYEVQPKLF